MSNRTIPRLSRRQVVGGVAASVAAWTAGGAGRFSAAAQEGEALTIALAVSPVDLDPQSAFEERSALVVGGIYEPLIRYAGDRTDEFEGVLAESWSVNDDRGVWTFVLREGIRFQDGSPCDAAAVKASFDRLFTLGLGPATELARFLTRRTRSRRRMSARWCSTSAVRSPSLSNASAPATGPPSATPPSCGSTRPTATGATPGRS